MKQTLKTALLIGLLVAMAPEALSAAFTLPSKEFVKKQVEMAGYNYDVLVVPRMRFPKTKLRIYTFFPVGLIEGAWKAMCREYQKLQPNVEIQFVMGPANYEEKLYTMIVAGVQPEIVMSEVGHVPYFLGNGLVLPLNSFIKADKWQKVVDDSFPIIIDRFTDEGKLYGMPTDTDPRGCIYYNKGLLNAAGLSVPSDAWTLDDMLLYARKLTQPDKKQWGFFTGDWKSIVYTNGGRLVDNYKKPTKYIFDSTKARAGFEWYKDLWVKHKVTPEPSKAGDPVGNFTNGKLAMFSSGIWESEFIAKKKGLEWDIARHPQLSAGSPAYVDNGGTCLSIIKGTKNQAVSWDLIKFLTGPVGQVYTAVSTGAQPAIERMFWTEVWAKNDTMPPANRQMMAELNRHVIYAPDTPVWPDIRTVMDTGLSKVWASRQSVDQFVSSALPQCQRLMDEAAARRRKARGQK